MVNEKVLRVRYHQVLEALGIDEEFIDPVATIHAIVKANTRLMIENEELVAKLNNRESIPNTLKAVSSNKTEFIDYEADDYEER